MAECLGRAGVSTVPTTSNKHYMLSNTDDIEVAVNKLSPHPTQNVSRATMSPMINALTNATVAAAIASVEEDTEVPAPRRTTRSQSARLNLAATF